MKYELGCITEKKYKYHTSYQAWFWHKKQKISFSSIHKDKVLARTVEVKHGLMLTEVNGKHPTCGHIAYIHRETKFGSGRYMTAKIVIDGKVYTRTRKVGFGVLTEMQQWLNEKILEQMSSYI